MKNRKIANIALILVVITLLFSTVAFARPYTAIFENGLLSINNFFEAEQYSPYSKAIDFFFFALLFTAVYMMGARYAFKEMKRPEQIIVILLGLMTAFLMVMADISATVLLPYIHWLFYVLLFFVYWWLLKGIQNKFWRFILALLLTILTIMLIMGLFRLAKPEISGPVFGDFFKGFGRISLPTGIGMPSYLRDFFGIRGGVPSVTGPITETTTPGEKGVCNPPYIVKGTDCCLDQNNNKICDVDEKEPTAPEKKRNWKWLWWLLLLLLPLLYFVPWKKLKREPRDRGEPETEWDIDKIIAELIRIIKLKQEILDKIGNIFEAKGKFVDDMYDRYHKVLKYDKAFWNDPDSEPFKQFLAQNDDIKKLLKLEFELQELLVKLMKEENDLVGLEKWLGKETEGFGKGYKWVQALIAIGGEKSIELVQEIEKTRKETPLLFWEKIGAIVSKYYTTVFSRYYAGSPEWFKATMDRIFANLRILMIKSDNGACHQVRRHIAHYFLLGKEEAAREKRWKKLIEPKTLEKWTRNKDKWKGIENVNPDSIKAHFAKDQEFIHEQFKPVIWNQMKYMYQLIRDLKSLKVNRDEFTEMQELRVEFFDEAGNKITLTKEQAADPANVIPRDKLIRVFTRLATGEGPFRLGVYVNTKIVGDPKNLKKIEKTESHPVIEFTSEEFGNSLGAYLMLHGPYDTPYDRPYEPSGTTGSREFAVTFYLISEPMAPKKGETPGAGRYRDVKQIKLHIGYGSEYPSREYPSKEYPPQPSPTEYPPTPSGMKDVSEGGQLYNNFDFFRSNVSIQISKRAFPSLKILHLSIPRDIKAGVVTAVDNLFKYEKDYGMYVQLINHWWNKDVYIINGRKITTQSSPYVFIGNINTSTKNMQNITDILTRANFIPDVIHVHTHTFEHDGALNVIRNAFPNAPVAYTLHQLIPHAYMTSSEKSRLEESNDEDVLDILGKYYSQGYEGRNKAQANTVKVSDGVIAISNSQLRYFNKFFKNYKGENIAIENGVDFFRFVSHPQIDAKGFELLSKYNLAGYKIILFVGRIEDAKGYQRTIKAFLKLLNDPKYKNSKLVFVGGYVSGIENKIMREGVSREILKEHIIFTPWVKNHLELAAWYRIGTVLVNPMFTDNLYSMVAKEAICTGLPVIACKGDMSIGQSRTDEDIYKALVYIFENPQEVKAHILRAFEICIRYHSVYASVEQHLEFYNKLIEKKKGRIVTPTPPYRRPVAPAVPPSAPSELHPHIFTPPTPEAPLIIPISSGAIKEFTQDFNALDSSAISQGNFMQKYGKTIYLLCEIKGKGENESAVIIENAGGNCYSWKISSDYYLGAVSRTNRYSKASHILGKLSFFFDLENENELDGDGKYIELIKPAILQKSDEGFRVIEKGLIRLLLSRPTPPTQTRTPSFPFSEPIAGDDFKPETPTAPPKPSLRGKVERHQEKGLDTEGLKALARELKKIGGEEQ